MRFLFSESNPISANFSVLIIPTPYDYIELPLTCKKKHWIFPGRQHQAPNQKITTVMSSKVHDGAQTMMSSGNSQHDIPSIAFHEWWRKNEDLTLKEREVLTRPTFRTQPAGWTSGSVLLSGFTFLSECKLYKTWKKNWINRICRIDLWVLSLTFASSEDNILCFFVRAVNGQFWSCLPGGVSQFPMMATHNSWNKYYLQHPSNRVFCLEGRPPKPRNVLF